MSLFRNKYRNESARLPGWDYSSPGYYFVTVCTHNRSHLFGHIDDGEMHLNEYGRIVQEQWDESFIIRRELIRDEFIIMPNHFHGIVGTHGRASLRGGDRASQRNQQRCGIAYRPPKSIPSFMAGVKSAITKQINELHNTPGARVLQPRFHDHIIRNEQELFRIRQYIKNNPANWKNDKLHDTDGNTVMEQTTEYGYEPWMEYA